MTARRTRRITWTLGIASALLLMAAGAGGWPLIVRGYRLQELRNDPSLLEAFLLAEDDGRRGAAALYIEEPEGRTALFDLYLREYERTTMQREVLRMLRRQVASGVATHGVLAIGKHGYVQVIRDDDGPGGNHASWGIGPDDLRRREVILAQLPAIEGEVFRVGRLPGLEFRLERVKGRSIEPWRPARLDGKNPRSHPIGWSERQPGMEHVCLFRVTGGRDGVGGGTL